MKKINNNNNDNNGKKVNKNKNYQSLLCCTNIYVQDWRMFVRNCRRTRSQSKTINTSYVSNNLKTFHPRCVLDNGNHSKYTRTQQLSITVLIEAETCCSNNTRIGVVFGWIYRYPYCSCQTMQC